MSTVVAAVVSFPVPWGHIAGLEWGDPSGKPVLAVHGQFIIIISSQYIIAVYTCV